MIKATLLADRTAQYYFRKCMVSISNIFDATGTRHVQCSPVHEIVFKNVHQTTQNVMSHVGWSVAYFFPTPDITRRCQSNEIEQKSQSNQSKTIERNRIIAIRLSNAIESQSNPKFWVKFDFVRFRSIAFEFVRLGSNSFD